MCSSTGTGNLTENDLRDVQNAICTARDKWFQIGQQLVIFPSTLNDITRKHRDATDCITEMLHEWLNSIPSPLTWSNLVQALSSASVGEKRLAEEIREQYCHQDGEQATGPAPGEV